MSIGRAAQTATLLANGQVLVAGGCVAGCGNLASAELYNPTTGTWRPTGSMAVPRGFHTATLLPSGRVLVAGGAPCSLCSDGLSAELYDPATGTWSRTGSLSHQPFQPTATLLPNGQVLLVTGGSDTAELYDPGTGTWHPTGSMSTFREFFTATLLATGQVLVTGGEGGGGGGPASAELYDPSTGRWTPTGSMATGRFAHTATLLPNGQVLVAGGADELDVTQVSAELYDPRRGTWQPTGSMFVGRRVHTATLLGNGEVLVAGGAAFGSTAELYDPSTGSWTLTGSMSTFRLFFTTTLLRDGQVLVAGGASSDFAGAPALASAELYTPAGADQVPPTTQATGSPAPNPVGWNRTDVTATLMATDNAGGSGVKSITFSAAGAQTLAQTTVTGSTTTVTITAEGTTTLSFFATDNAGNAEAPKSLVVRIDKTAPEARVQFDPARRDVVVIGTDNLSGVPAGPIAPISVTPTSAGQDDEDGDQHDGGQARAELRTFVIQDAAGNTLRLVLKVRRDEHDLRAQVVSLQINGAAVITPAQNSLRVEFELEKAGQLKEMQQEVRAGAGQDRQTAEADFDAGGNQTRIEVKQGGPEQKLTRPGLVLLALATNKGALQITF